MNRKKISKPFWILDPLKMLFEFLIFRVFLFIFCCCRLSDTQICHMHILWFRFTNSRTLSIWRNFFFALHFRFINLSFIRMVFDMFPIIFFLLGDRAFLIFTAFGSVFSGLFFSVTLFSYLHRTLSPLVLCIFQHIYRPLSSIFSLISFVSFFLRCPLFSFSRSLFFFLHRLYHPLVVFFRLLLALFLFSRGCLSKWVVLWFEMSFPNEIIPTRERSRWYL